MRPGERAGGLFGSIRFVGGWPSRNAARKKHAARARLREQNAATRLPKRPDGDETVGSVFYDSRGRASS